jgi:outer membrane protein assembly factor BamA
VLTFLPWLPLAGQTFCDSTAVGKPVRSIQVFGNEKTRAEVILREMKTREGDPLNPDRLEADRRRIQSLNLFTRVQLVAVPQADGAAIQVIVSEQWYIFPYPILFINDRDWGKISYGAGITHTNFRGRAEVLLFSFWLGYDPAVQLTYSNPWVGGAAYLFTDVGAGYKRVRSKHYQDQEVDEIYVGGHWSLGKRFGHHLYTYTSFSYREVIFSPALPGQTLSPKGRDRLPSLGAGAVWDRRDLAEYPHRGWRVSVSASKTGISSMTADYFRWAGDARIYIPLIRRSTLAVRAAATMASGTLPIYERVYLGYSERVRGHYYTEWEGEHRFLVSASFRFPILPVRYIDLGEMPYMRDLPFGISLGFFADTGMVWFQDEKLAASRFISGYGIGIHLHLPYIQVLRLETAFDEKGRAQFIVDMGVDI